MIVLVLGKSIHERRHGNAQHVNGIDDDCDDSRKPQGQLGESHDGACCSGEVYYTAEQWDPFEEYFGQNDGAVFHDDDEELSALILEESDALAAESQYTAQWPKRARRSTMLE